MRQVKIDKYVQNDSVIWDDGKVMWDFNWAFLKESTFNNLSKHDEVTFDDLILVDGKKNIAKNKMKNKWL